MNKYLYEILKLDEKPWIKFWIIKKKTWYTLSEILKGTNFSINNTKYKKFNIFNIFGNSTQFTTTGKNIFDGILENGQWSNSTGIALNTPNYVRSQNYIEVDGGEQYVASSTTTGLSFIFAQYDENKTFIAAGNSPITLRENCKYVKLSIHDTTNLGLKVQIEKGSTATSYEKYTGGIPAPNPDYEEEINSAGINGIINEKIVNRNLFDKANISWYRNNSSDFSNTSNSSTERIRTSPFQLIPGKTYKVSGYPSSVTLKAIRTYNKDEIKLRQFTGVSSFTLTSEENYIHLLFGGENFDDSTNTMMANADIQIEEGSTATNYVPHQEQNFNIPCQQPMRKIGDVADTFIKENGVWYERHYIFRKIFTGTETVTKGGTTNNNQFIISGLITDADTQYLGNYNDNVISKILSNYFVPIGSTSNNNGSIGITLCNYSPNTQIRFGLGINSIITTVTDFKAWLVQKYSNENPVYLDYILAEPIDILCTSEQIQVLENLENAKTYNNQTNIFSEDEIPANLEIQCFLKKEGD